MEAIDHPVSRYATDVLERRIIAGELVRKACERHLADLETAADRGLRFDCDAADKIVRFARLLKHTTGPLAGKPLELQPWQVFRQGSVFGWKREDGSRRFRTAYHQVAKKNGKTTETAVPAVFCLTFDGEAAPQVYAAATTRDQAGLLFREVNRMAKRSEIGGLLKKTKHELTCPFTDGYFKCLSRDGDTSDGINPHFVSKDEVHRWTDRELGEVISQSMIARAQPIDWSITTAGQDRAGYCGEMREYAEKVLTGIVEDDEFFAYVAEPPQDCDPADELAWAMANPNLGVSITKERLEVLLRRAQVIKASMANFRRLHLNLWTAAETTWIDAEVWAKMGAPFTREELRGRPAWAALDLSSSVDLSALVVAVPVGELIYLVTYSFLPAGAAGFAERVSKEKREYQSWRDRGWLEVHDDRGSIDRRRVLARCLEVAEFFELRELAFDRWGLAEMIRDLEDAGLPLVQHGQGFASMSAPMKGFEAAVADGRLRHGGNPVLAWAIGNVFRDSDPAEQVKPNKRRSKGRIDPAVAAIMAVGRAMADDGYSDPEEILSI